MPRKETSHQAEGLMVFIYVMINAVLIRKAFVEGDSWYWLMLLSLPLLLISKLKPIKKPLNKNTHE